MRDRRASLIDSPVLHFDIVDSTSLEAQRRAAIGERGPLWITAGVQTHGRGRSGRSFTSADGALMTTLLLTCGCGAARVPELSLVSGVAMRDAAAAVLGDDATVRSGLRLKWPNDLLVHDGKVGGILIECANYGSELVAMIGMGVNIAARPDVPDRAVAALADHAADAHADVVFAELRAAMNRWLEVWAWGDGFPAIRDAWAERAGPSGEVMSINAGEGPVKGRYLGLAVDGALLMQDDGGAERRFSFGDVTLVGRER
jgi:BirA family biotin operon repressor/biotin-[acetyl-CoA-carboxylase] ligase